MSKLLALGSWLLGEVPALRLESIACGRFFVLVFCVSVSEVAASRSRHTPPLRKSGGAPLSRGETMSFLAFMPLRGYIQSFQICPKGIIWNWPTATGFLLLLFNYPLKSPTLNLLNKLLNVPLDNIPGCDIILTIVTKSNIVTIVSSLFRR